MLSRTHVVAFSLLILQEFYIKQEELIGYKLIFILQGIKLLFSKDSSIIIYLGYFSLSYTVRGENSFRLLFYLFFIILKSYFNWFELYLNLIQILPINIKVFIFKSINTLCKDKILKLDNIIAFKSIQSV